MVRLLLFFNQVSVRNIEGEVEGGRGVLEVIVDRGAMVENLSQQDCPTWPPAMTLNHVLLGCLSSSACTSVFMVCF